MKVKIFYILLFFGLNQLNAQVSPNPVVFKQPKNFVYIPQKNSNPAFFVMKEPVKIIEFKEFINVINSQFNIVDANTCKLASPDDHYKPTIYQIFSNPKPIELYAKYLSEKLSDSNYIVTCFPLNESMWNQFNGPKTLVDTKKPNPFGLIFFSDIEEYKKNAKGEYIKISDINGYQRGTFRIAFTITPRKIDANK